MENFREAMKKTEPSFDQIEAALDKFAAGKPVTERCVENGERIIVERSDKLGKIRVRSGNLLLRTFSFTPRPDSEGPVWRSSEDHRPSKNGA